MTKRTYRSHTWFHGERYVAEMCQVGGDDAPVYITTGGKSPILTYHSWGEAESALPEVLAKNGLPAVANTPPMHRWYNYRLDGGVVQGLVTMKPGEVRWMLSNNNQDVGYLALQGNAPTWEGAIEESLRMLPRFHEILKEKASR